MKIVYLSLCVTLNYTSQWVLFAERWLMTSKSPHNQGHAACLILLPVDVSVPLLWLCNQKTMWLLKAEIPVYAVFTIQSWSETIAFFSGVWEFHLLNAATTNKNQHCPSWCLPVPHTWLSHSWTARGHLFQRLEPPQLTHSDAEEQQLHSFPVDGPTASLTRAPTAFRLLSSLARY